MKFKKQRLSVDRADETESIDIVQSRKNFFGDEKYEFKKSSLKRSGLRRPPP
jgi:hypothetical protein